MNPNRIGLLFNQDHITATQSKDDSYHIATAFDFLSHTDDDNPLVQAYQLGLRHRFMNDTGSGERAVDLVQQVQLDTISDYYQSIRTSLAWVSVVEMIRDLSSWQTIESSWFTQQLQPILDALGQPPDDATLLDKFWLAALQCGAGIVLNDDTLFAQSHDFYHQAIEHHIHPEGYLRGLVDAEDATDTYYKQVSGTAALTLIAEMADNADVDLWAVDNRGVTPMTAATYTMYYYYYPEKWQWEDGLKEDTVQAIMKAEGAFIEIANRRQYLRAIEQLFEDQRPMFSVYAGGLTTLTHGTPAPRKKKKGWSLFGG